MALQLKQAQRQKAYLKLGIAAPSGGGKTMGALLIGYGLMKEKYPNETDAFRWGKIAIIDTENGSGELYVGSTVKNTKIGVYNAITINKPFSVEKYLEAIQLCQDSEMEVCIIDSSTHLWSSEGGLLDKQGQIAKRLGNSYAAWREITPLHNDFVSAMLQSPMHVIATMRSKQEYVQEKSDGGKTTIRKVGLEPEQRKGMEYEFTVFFEINNEHEAFGAKDRTQLYDQQTFVITPEVGISLMKWLNNVDTSDPVILGTSHKADPEPAIADIKAEVLELCVALGGSKNEDVVATVKKYTKTGNPNAISDIKDVAKLRSDLVDLQNQQETN